jgi:hypothetical protein
MNATPLHVLMTADATGGVWTYATALMQALRPAGVTFTLAVMGRSPSESQRARVEAMDHVRLRTHPHRLEWMPDSDRDMQMAAGRWLQRLVTRIAPDVVHLNGYAHAALPFDRPVVSVVHGIVRSATKESCIFAAGRFWDEANNLAVLDEIATTLPWPVIAAGSTEGPDSTPRTPRNVWHLGEIDRTELQHRLARAAIYAHPARYEPFGLGVLEAAQAGCALVLGDIPSLREIWGDAALYVHPDDRVGLHSALTELIAQRSLRTQLGAAARARACAVTDHRMAEQYLALYQTLDAERAAPRSISEEMLVQTREVATCEL